MIETSTANVAWMVDQSDVSVCISNTWMPSSSNPGDKVREYPIREGARKNIAMPMLTHMLTHMLMSQGCVSTAHDEAETHRPVKSSFRQSEVSRA